MLRALKFFGLLVVNIVVAVIGTTILDTAIGKTFHAHSLSAILWKEWSLSIGCAAVIGFGMWRTWRSDPAKWAWVLVAVWFGLRFILAIGSGAARCGISFRVLGVQAGFAQSNAATSSSSQYRSFAEFPIRLVLTLPRSFSTPTALWSQLFSLRLTRSY